MRVLHAIVVAVPLALSACASQKVRDDSEVVPPEAAAAMPQAADGAIYAANNGLTLFEDQKAHRVGDILTVLLVEKTDAQKKADTSASKKDSASITAPTVFGRVLSYGSELGADRSFAGSGASTQSNALSGSVTVVITRVMPNGNLLIRGEKNLQLNQGSEKVAVEGLVRPLDITTSNTITSDRVANARISYAGNGALAAANSQGWLSRFFSSALFPF